MGCGCNKTKKKKEIFIHANSNISPIKEIAVIGSPSNLGGADTELGHQMFCWLKMGLKVHVCHTGALDANLMAIKTKYEPLGVMYHTPRDWRSLEGLDCISFCNGEFLKELSEIKKHVRSATFVNCMTWNFPLEIQRQKEGLIDFHLYQTPHAFDRVSKGLKKFDNYKPLMVQPYFHTEDFPFHEKRPGDTFKFGRISRGDADKYNRSQLWIYETMTAPVLKEGIILGWDHRARRKFGKDPDSYIKALPEGGITQQEFYKFCDAVIMTTDTFENLPRVGFEAMASGSVLVVDRKGGWELQVEHGVTGWLPRSDREFVYNSSRLAFEKQEREDMRHKAKEKLDREWGMEASMKSWERALRAIAAK